MADSNNAMPHTPKRWLSAVDIHPRALLIVTVIGAMVGLVLWALTLFLQQSVLSPVLCADKTTNSKCVDALVVSSGLATLIAGVIGLFGLVLVGVFRPLFIVTASAATLWGLGVWVNGFLWYEALLWSLLLYGACYLAFSWLARLRVFGSALTIGIVIIIIARWLASI